MRVLVVGAHGRLGATVVRECRWVHDITALSHADLDITDNRAVADAIARAGPDVIVNTAAYNDVDAAEDDPLTALTVNAFGVLALARAAREVRAALVHYSTDFVFDGLTSAPYAETDQPNPLGVYAASKLLGEWFAADAGRWYVLRVESLFGSPAPEAVRRGGSAEAILKALREGREARVFEDRTVSPTCIVDAARATRHIIERLPDPGVYHLVNSGHCTWLEFAREAARRLGVEPRLVPITLESVHLRARRPRYCALSNEKLASVGVDMPTWQDALGRLVEGRA
jgi:dTDP-4-dehydrorhamnose reductase